MVVKQPICATRWAGANQLAALEPVARGKSERHQQFTSHRVDDVNKLSSALPVSPRREYLHSSSRCERQGVQGAEPDAYLPWH